MTTSRDVPPISGADVVIVDDHPLLVQSLTFALRADGLEVIRCQDLSDAAIVDCVARHAPAVVLLDLDLGSEFGSAVPLIPELNEHAGAVVILTGVTDRIRLAESIEAGAIGLVTKSEPFERLVTAIRTAIAGGRLLHPVERDALLGELRRHRAALQQRRAGFERLTPREAQVLGALMDGWPAERIAREWVVSITTVRGQIRAVLAKLEVNSQLAAVARARQAGWSLEGR